MTTLRDDGMMETDDPVVAACFLGCHVHDAGGSGAHDILHQISKDVFFFDEFSCGTILIPAATVAEVCGFNRVTSADLTNAYFHIAIVLAGRGVNGDSALWDWLRTHTQEQADE